MDGPQAGACPAIPGWTRAIAGRSAAQDVISRGATMNIYGACIGAFSWHVEWPMLGRLATTGNRDILERQLRGRPLTESRHVDEA